MTPESTGFKREIDYPTVVSDPQLVGRTVRLPLFPGRMTKVERAYPIGKNWFVRFSNGNLGGSYPSDYVFTVVSDN